MRRVLKWLAIILGGLVGVAVVVALVLIFMARSRLNREYDVQVQNIPIPGDEAALERGQHLVEAVSDCSGCHGPEYGGMPFFEDPMIGTVVSSNLTSGQGGIGDSYGDEDWVRAIRHGVGPEGLPLFIMPSQHFYRYSDEDLGAIISYLQSVPPVDRQSEGRQLSPLAYILLATGALGPDAIPAEVIDHDQPHPAPPEPGATAAYGEHLTYVATCRDCHGAELAGGQAGPGEPIGPNLTPGGELGQWSEEDFFALMRSGRTPEGREVNPFMPWRAFSQMNDEELRAIWLYLQSLPAREDAIQEQG